MAEPTTYTNVPYERKTNAWGWIIPLIIVAAAVAAYAYYHNRAGDNNTPAASSTTSQTSSGTTQSQSVQKTSDLSTATAGTRAQLSNIAISQVVSSRIFTIKSGSQTIYTILSPNVNLPNKTTLQTGQQVAITGTLVSTNSDQFKNLNLTAAEKSALGNQSLVLLVDQVTISGSNATTNPSTTP
ncbi:MAG: hypothetical protein KW788_04370 [Candidatus Doudnabacteria bacterium]|nr:hypothetical protein [Candidatus Doudnabacteria bacterium]